MLWSRRKPQVAEPGHWQVFMVRCADGSLYTDAAPNADEAVVSINSGRGPAYTRTRLPVFRVYTEEFMNERDALRRVGQMRTLSRPGKERLLAERSLDSLGESGRARAGLRVLFELLR